jgi:hypothetical protein
MSGTGVVVHTTDIFELQISLKGYKCAGSRLLESWVLNSCQAVLRTVQLAAVVGIHRRRGG